MLGLPLLSVELKYGMLEFMTQSAKLFPQLKPPSHLALTLARWRSKMGKGLTGTRKKGPTQVPRDQKLLVC